MERITTQMTAQMTIADLTQAFDRLNKTQNELSSGKRINQPSDDPYGAGLAVQLNGEIAGLNSYSQNVTDGTGWTQAADSSLSGMNDMVQRIRELLVEAGNDTTSQSARDDAAAEINQLTDAIKQQANATYDGQYIFSGSLTTTPPYQSGSNDAYAGNSAAVNRLIGPGTSVQVNTDISQLLGGGQSAADGKLLDTLRTISSDLSSGNGNGLRGADLQNLDTNLSTLQQLQANVGAVENRLSLASSRIQDLQVSDTQRLSSVQDADMARTTIDYSTEQAAYTAALRASANIIQSSLLNFLQ